MKRKFYTLDVHSAIARESDSCRKRSFLEKLPPQVVQHYCEGPLNVVGISFAADVHERCKQTILLLQETTTTITATSISSDKKSNTLPNALASLCSMLHPLDGQPAPGFIALRNDSTLGSLGIGLEIGRVKNINKNSVAEKAIAELEDEILRQTPNGGPHMNSYASRREI